MKMVRLCLLLMMSVLWIPVQATDTDSIPWYGRLSVSLGHDSVRNVGIGLTSVVPSLKGFQMNLIGGGVYNNMSGVSICGLVGITSKDANGVQIAGFNYVGQRMRGLSIGGICIIGEGLYGLQIGGLNMAAIEMKGVQIGFLNGGQNSGLQMGVVNMTGDNSGVCVGGLNLGGGHTGGLQLGGENFADSLSGVQIGIFNQCHSNSNGTQIGIINCCGEEGGRQYGLININPRTRSQMIVAAGSYTPVNLALRIRNRHRYNVIGIGLGQKGWDDYIYSSVYYRIGQYFTLFPHFTLSGDVGIAAMSVMRKEADAPDMFSLEGRLNVEYEVHPKASLFATVGYASTRYISDGKPFRQKPFVELGVALF